MHFPPSPIFLLLLLFFDIHGHHLHHTPESLILRRSYNKYVLPQGGEEEELSVTRQGAGMRNLLFARQLCIFRFSKSERKAASDKRRLLQVGFVIICFIIQLDLSCPRHLRDGERREDGADILIFTWTLQTQGRSFIGMLFVID